MRICRGRGDAGHDPALLVVDEKRGVANLSAVWSRGARDDLFNERLVALLEMKTFTLKNKLGMHARAAALFVRIAQKYRAEIVIERNGQTVNGKSILGILTLACPMGGQITVSARGNDAEQALAELETLIENKFGEE
jgi:phosphocarrier protein